MLLAKIKQESRYGVTTACSGAEFVKYEWRQVPAGMEEEARRNPILETREGELPKVTPLKARQVGSVVPLTTMGNQPTESEGTGEEMTEETESETLTDETEVEETTAEETPKRRGRQPKKVE